MWESPGNPCNDNDDIYLSIYIVIHRQTVLLYYNSSMWLDTQSALSWDWNPSDFTKSDILLHIHQQTQHKWRDFTYMYYFSFVYIYTLNGYQVLNSLEELCIIYIYIVTDFTTKKSLQIMKKGIVNGQELKQVLMIKSGH